MKIKLTIIILALSCTTINLFAAPPPLPAPLPEFMNQQQLDQWTAKEASHKQDSASAQKAPTQFYTGKPYAADVDGYIYNYRTYNPEMSRWTSADPSGFPDGVNNQRYAPSPTFELDSSGLDVIPVNGESNPATPGTISLTDKVRIPGTWSSINPAGGSNGHELQTDLNAITGSGADSSNYSVSGATTYNTSTGAWGPIPMASSINITSDNPAGNSAFTFHIGTSDYVGTLTLSMVTLSAVSVTQTGSTPYVPASTVDGVAVPAQMATITYSIGMNVKFTEATTYVLENTTTPITNGPGATPQEKQGALTITFIE